MIKRLLWLLPLFAIVGGALSSFMFYRSTTGLLNALGQVDSPTLSRTQTLIFDVKGLADGIKSAVAAADKDALHATESRAEEFKTHLSQYASVPGQAQEAIHIQQLFNAYMQAAMSVAGILLDGKAGDVSEAAQAMQTALASLDGTLRQNKEAAQQSLDAHIQAAHDLAHAWLIASIGATLVILVLSGAVARIKLRDLLKQLGGTPGEAANIVQRIASGDLSEPVKVRTDAHGSLLDAMRHMQEHLAHVIGDVNQAVHAVRIASSEISCGNHALADRSIRQASNLQASAASVEQLTSSVRYNADSADQARVLAEQASAHADQGSRAVSNAVSTMNEVSERARKIVEITSLIDGIAFQTNILALNAAVEAARAGEQGRGFGVVAAEVRTLAQRAGAASKEIKALIEDSAHHIQQGASHVNAAGAAMGDLVSSVRRVGEHIAHISLASAEQRDGIELVNRSVAELDAATQENHTMVEQAGQAALSLQEVAQQLGEAVGRFQLSHT